MSKTHVYRVPLADLERTVNERTVQATEGAIIDGELYVLRIDSTTAYVHATPSNAAKAGWTTLANGATRWSWSDIAPEEGLTLADVYRARSGASLRQQAATATGEVIPARSKAPRVAVDFARTESEKSNALRTTVRDIDVEAGDVVEENTRPPHAWM